MKLYYMAGGCSLAVHIAALEAGIELELIELIIHPDGSKTAGGQDFLSVNPKGFTPALEVADGILTEAQVDLQYIASLAPDKLPIPAAGMQRFRMLETLNFVASDIHRGFSPLFNPLISPAHKQDTIRAVGRAFTAAERILGDRAFFVGETFGIADAYAFAVTRWAASFDIQLSDWPVLHAWRQRIAQRPTVIRAMRAEGLI